MASRKIENRALLMIQLYKSPEERYVDLDKSLEELRVKINSLNSKAVRWRSDEGIRYQFWPGFMDLAALITSTGLGVGVYNLLKLWLESRNGRRFKIKIGDVEVESTQLNEENFLKLLDKAFKLRKKSVGDTNIPSEKVKTENKLKDLSINSSFRHELTIGEFINLYYQQEHDNESNKPNEADR